MKQPLKRAKPSPSQQFANGLRPSRRHTSANSGALADAIAQSPQAAAQRKLASMVSQSPRMIAQREQGAARQSAAAPNRTGLPDRLKAGVERLSGMALDDVKVHYNSPKPAQLQALAYAQGSSIHLAPGQERHLPHEAWHVVQQRQGRVRPTMQMKSVAVNDERHLEAEADAMGARAMAAGAVSAASDGIREQAAGSIPASGRAPVMQGVLVVGKDSFYNAGDLQKKKALWGQFEKASTEAQKKLLEWMAHDDDLPHPKVNTMGDAIKSAQSAADKEAPPKPPSISGLSISNSNDGPSMVASSSNAHQEIEEKKSEEKKTASVLEHPGAAGAMALEEEISAQKDDAVRNYINKNAAKLKKALSLLIQQAETARHPDDILQIHRFIGTDEFGKLYNNKNTSKLCNQLVELATHKAGKARLFDIRTLVTLIPEEWEVTGEVLGAWEKRKIHDARHGADSTTLKPIDEIRLSQTIAELQICKPQLQAIFTLGISTGLFRGPENFFPLILRVLEGTARRFKISSVLELLHFYRDCIPTLHTFTSQKRMTESANAGLHMALLDAVQGEGHRSREQQKMLLVLITHLNAHPNERCLAYEPGGTANYDLLTHDTETEDKKIIEVETIPAKERANAYAFYKEKYRKKMLSINATGEAEGARLFLFIPIETKLPKAQIDLIKADPDLLVANIDQIQPSTELD